MNFIYQKEFNSRTVTDKELQYIYNFYPLKEAVFIPVIKSEYRVDELMKNAGDINDEIIAEILSDLNEEIYIGTNKHLDNYYSDYYESEDAFVNVLYSVVDGICYVEAVFYSSNLIEI